ncbi:helix-turn-helix domain-containing protein [Rhizobium hainanense]|uniref:helix-turn-helix domain-containing protein n=1 Tax=Rhizobium hainanense TaxID=52131 RepID=UPI0013565362|nr:helix-turn-helix domain-containing protein [Rhizobium hainanense]
MEHAGYGFSFACDAVSNGPLTLINVEYGGEIINRRRTAGDKMIVIFPHSGESLIETRKGTIHSTPGFATVLDGAHNDGMSFFGRRRHTTAVLCRLEMQTRLCGLVERTVSGDFDFNPEINLSTSSGSTLLQLGCLIHQGLTENSALQRSPIVMKNLTESFFQMLLLSVPNNFSEQLHGNIASPSPGHVKRAIDYMRAHLSEPLTLEDIAFASGTGARALQMGFRQFKSSSPMSYLRNLRLEAVHQELSSNPSASSVSDVAIRWGFVQLGRFSGEYRVRYGELPSDTLRKSKL